MDPTPQQPLTQAEQSMSHTVRPVSDMSPAEFRKHGYAVIDWIANYLDAPEKWPVLPAVRPGDVRGAPPTIPARAGRINGGDSRRLPAAHRPRHHALESPAFMAYFANSATAAGVLGETLTAAPQRQRHAVENKSGCNRARGADPGLAAANARATDGFFGIIGDTASSNTLYALAAAREMHPELRSGRGNVGEGRSAKGRRLLLRGAHSSVDKAVMTLGFWLETLKKIPTDSATEMGPKALAAAVENDRRADACRSPSSNGGDDFDNGIDPVAEMAEIADATDVAPRRCFVRRNRGRFCPRCGTCSTDATGPTPWW